MTSNPRWHSWMTQRRLRGLAVRSLSRVTLTDSLQRRNPSLEKRANRQKSLLGGTTLPSAWSSTYPLVSANASSTRHHFRMTSLSIWTVWSFSYGRRSSTVSKTSTPPVLQPDGTGLGFSCYRLNMTRYALFFALLVGGCSFGIDKLNAAGGDGLSDLGTEDLAQPPDLIGLDLTDVDLADPSDL